MAGCCTTSICACSPSQAATYTPASTVNTLAFDATRCINCGMCLAVCPQGVFAANGRTVQIIRAEACMECGACMRNCPAGALQVDSGVGCAAAMIAAALTGRKEVTCGGPDTACCG